MRTGGCASASAGACKQRRQSLPEASRLMKRCVSVLFCYALLTKHSMPLPVFHLSSLCHVLAH